MSKINAGQASSTLISKYIGSDFDAVLEVADNIEAIKLVAKTIEVPIASEAKAGIAKIATQIEVNQKTNDNHIVTPKKLGAYAAPLEHIHDTATHTESGFLAANDKQKLDGIADNANNYTHPTIDGSLHVPATGTDNNGKLLKAGATAGSLVWDTISKTDVGLSNVDNTSDLNKPISIATQAALDGKSATGHTHSYLPLIGGTLTGALIGTTFTGALNGNATTATKLATARTINGVSFDGSANITINAVDSTSRIASSEKGIANGVATLGSDGKISSVQLPSYVDDVLEYANFTAFPLTGEASKIYVALDTNKTYRWSGSAYVYITSGAVDSVAGKTGVVTLVKADVGLGNVDNTSDLSKPISTAQQSALDLKANLESPVLTGTPSAPTATVGTSSTQIATTAFVNAEIANDATPKSHIGTTGTAHGVATTSVAGFMSSADKTKLDGIAASANNYMHPASGVTAGTYKSVTVDANGHITAGTNPTTLSGYGITDAASLSHTHSYLPLTGGTLTGNLSVTSAGQASIEIGRVDGVASTPFIDFHAGATAVDYDVRAITLSGTGVNGGGTLQIVAGNVIMSKATITDIVGTTISATTFSGALSGNASTASTLQTSRAITLAGDVSGNASFNGASDISISATLANSGVTAGTYRSVTVDTKGRVTAGTNPTTLAGYGITDAISSSSKGVANGVATLDATGKVTAAQLPLDAVQSVDGLTGVVELPLATEAAPGKAAIATTAEVIAGTDNTKFITPAKLAGYAQPIDSTLTAMSGVVTAADKLIYFNGVDTATSTTLTSFARTLLDDTSAAAAQSTLGVLANNRSFKIPADIATTANLTATYANGSSGVGATLTNSGTLAALVLDGVTATTNMRVLVKNQTTASQNGIYTVTNVGSASVAWVLTRATDADVTAELAGAVISVDQGTANGAALFTNDWKKTYTVGTTAMGWRAVLDSVNYSTYVQPMDATLTALASVTTAADKLIYATAPDVFTTTSITPFARTLIDDVDAAAMRTTLGIDGLPILTFIGSTPPTNPWNGVTWYCTDDGRTYVYYVDTDSSQWVESSPQSPATTDTLSGTNANGDYTKFADGTLICWTSTTTSASATKVITYPMAFISAPVCTVTVEATTPCVATTQSPSVTGISINGWNMSSARAAVVCKIMAVGRWK